MLEAAQWVFATAVHDATSDRIYLNGALVATGASVDPTASGNVTPKIGRWHQSTNEVLYGAVDEVSVWADALTDEEVATLAGSGGLADDPDVRSVVNTTGAYTAEAGDVVLAAGTFTVTLPTAVGLLGEEITVKNTGAGTITIGRTSSQTIDGAASNDSLAAQEARTYMSDGGGWHVIGGYL